MTQLDLFLDEEEVNTSDSVDLSDIDIDFGEANYSQRRCSETIRRLQSLPKGKYIIYRRDAESGLPYVVNRHLGKRLKPSYTRDKYISVKLNFNNGKNLNGSLPYCRLYLHQIVAMAFIPNVLPKDRVEVDHIDCDKHNYAPENLRWVTHSENIKNMWSQR
jgi:hypothetical protein